MTAAVSGESWVPILEASPFPLRNLPYGIGTIDAGTPRAWVAIGDGALDLAAVDAEGLLDGTGAPTGCFGEPSLNRFLAAGRPTWRAVRARLQELLGDDANRPRLADALRPQASLDMRLPVSVGDYVDFYSSLHHATNLGRMFRPDGDPLLANWRHIPVGYHGRTATLVADGATIPRPRGLRLVDGEPAFGASEALDIELEVGVIVGVGSVRGTAIPVDDADEHLFGVCLVNDWSARDIQAFEYQPLGPFLAKSFATSLSPWLVTFEALAPFRVDPPPQVPEVAPYLRTSGPTALDLYLEVLLESAKMRAAGSPPVVISRTRFADMYWTAPQQLAHLTVNGAATRAGDLFASGTVSGPEPGSEGSLIELTRLGEQPLTLPDGSSRSFLEDGDRVILSGWAGADGDERIGLGSVSGTVTGERS